MKFVDKLKNIFFEEEEAEEIEDTRPLKKIEKEPKKEKEVIARKIELPRKNKEVDQDENDIVGEIKIDIPKKTKNNEYTEINQEPIKTVKKDQPKITEMIFDDNDFILNNEISKKEEVKQSDNLNYKTRENKTIGSRETPSYEYKGREETKVKTFTPSPIISPIYGILDKNYKKEEVKERKEVRISSRVSRMDLDSVRNKAFGDLESELFANTPTVELEEEKDELPKKDIKKIKKELEEDGKPAIDKVTLGEADEYFNDLGLAYNTDYKDISKEINDGRITTKKEEKGDKLEDNLFDLIENMYDKED